MIYIFCVITGLKLSERNLEFTLLHDTLNLNYSYQYVRGDKLIPFDEFFVGLPPEGEIEVNIEKEGSMLLPYSLPSLPYWERREENLELQSEKEIEIDYGVWRGLKVARIRYFPYYEVGNKLHLPRRTHINIKIKGEIRYNGGGDYALDRLLRRKILNYSVASKFERIKKEVHLSSFDRSKEWIKIICEKKGIYSITGKELKKYGWTENMDPSLVALYTVPVYPVNGPYPDSMIQVPIIVEGEENGKLDDGDRIIFFAPGTDLHTDTTGEEKNIYSRREIFFLAYPVENPSRMEDVGSKGGEYTGIEGWNIFEEDSINPAQSGTLWLWKEVNSRGAEGVNLGNEEIIQFPLPDDIEIWGVRIELYAERGSGDLPVGIEIEGEEVAREYMEKRGTSTPNIIEKVFEKGYKTNKIKVINYGMGDSLNVYIDRVSLLLKGNPLGDNFIFVTSKGSMELDDKHILLNITGSRVLNPLLISGEGIVSLEQGRYVLFNKKKLLKPGLESFSPPDIPQPGAEMLIIVPDKFLGAAYRWRQFREERFKRVEVFTLEEIYNLNYGIEEPGSIKKLIEFMGPQYVGLGADAGYDMRGILDEDYRDKVPVYIHGRSTSFKPTVLEGTAYADDKWFVDFEEDNYYDAIIGRIPAHSPEELAFTVERIKDYEMEKMSPWMNRIIFVADDEYIDGKKTDNGVVAYFHNLEDLKDIFPEGMEYMKLYTMFYPLTGIEKPEAREDFIKILSEGGVMGVYFGHGNQEQLAHEKIFRLGDVDEVSNGLRSPFFIFGTCGAAWYDRLTVSCIAEELLLNKKGGVIASIGSPKGTYQGENSDIVQKIVTYIVDDIDKRAGDAFFYAVTGKVSSYTFLGDPAISIKLPVEKEIKIIPPSAIKEGKKNTIVIDNRDDNSYNALIKLYATKEIKEYTTEMANGTVYEFKTTFERGIYSEIWKKIPENTIDSIHFIPPVGIPKGENSHISILALKGDTLFVYGINRITYDTSMVKEDDEKGPEVELYINGIRLRDGMEVPESFLLQGVVWDESGVLMLNSGTKSSGFYTKSYEDWTDITPYFKVSSDGKVHFEVPVSMNGDSLVLIVYDNLLNATRVSFKLNVRTADYIEISNPMVWPNPVDRDYLYFTFSLSQDAVYSIDIYTISGRHLARIPERMGRMGYNQIRWDMKDRNGNVLPNGPYFYVLRVGSGSKRKIYKGRFLVWR